MKIFVRYEFVINLWLNWDILFCCNGVFDILWLFDLVILL